MHYKDITGIGYQETLLEIVIDGLVVDLHNDFAYQRFELQSDNLCFYFRKQINNSSYDENNLVVIFSGIKNYSHTYENIYCRPVGVDNFGRGEITETHMYFSKKDLRYYYIEFEDCMSIDIFCNSAFIFLW